MNFDKKRVVAVLKITRSNYTQRICTSHAQRPIDVGVLFAKKGNQLTRALQLICVHIVVAFTCKSYGKSVSQSPTSAK